MARLLPFSPARLDQSPLICRGHENNCSRQTGRREQSYSTRCISLHVIQGKRFVVKLLSMIWHSLASFWEWKKVWSVLIIWTSHSSTICLDIKLLIRDLLVLMSAYSKNGLCVFFTGKPMSENPQGSIFCINGWSFKSIAIYRSRGWNPSLVTQEVRLSAQMKNKPIRGKTTV